MTFNQKQTDSLDLESSLCSSRNKNQTDFQKLSDTLQYLDRIRSINKKVFDSKSSNQNSLISPLEKLVHSDQQITYIDNLRLYGIIKIENFINLKNRVKQLQEQQQSYKIDKQDLDTKSVFCQRQITHLRHKQAQLNHSVNQLTKSFNQEKNLRNAAELKIQEISDCLVKLNHEKTHDSLKYLALLTDYASLTAKSQKLASNLPSHQMICESQTQFYKQTIDIPPFEPNLEEILRKIREKQGEKVSRQSLKQIVAQSLDAFVKELGNQYKLIYEQTIDLNKLREQNQILIKKNTELKHQIQELNIEEEKLKIFRNCMTSFLDGTSEKISKCIQEEHTHKRINEKLIEYQRNLFIQTFPDVENLQEEGYENLEIKELKIMKQKMESLKEENIELLKAIGDYQYKIKNVEKILEESRRQEIPDEGVVGQLVKMSKLVKESVKSLLNEL